MGRSGKGGFTSIEVTVTIAIMAAVSVMLTPARDTRRPRPRWTGPKRRYSPWRIAFRATSPSAARCPAIPMATASSASPRSSRSWPSGAFSATLKPNTSCNVIDPWDNAYVIVLSRDYAARAADVLSDTLGRPYNDLPDGFQVYSRELGSEDIPRATSPI